MSGSGRGARRRGSDSRRRPPAPASRTRTGLKIAGLDLANTPYMIMSGTNGMDMNGADASAAAGLQHDDAQLALHRSRPAAGRGAAQLLTQDGNNGPADIHMAESGCAPALTATAGDRGRSSTCRRPARRCRATPRRRRRWPPGYVPASPTDYPVVAYVNPTIVAANAAAQRTLDPAHVDGLVYATTPSGDRRARRRHVHPPVDRDQRARCPTARWCSGTAAPRCAGTATTVAHHAAATSPASRRAPSGSTLQPTPYVSMVWQVPVAGGPLAIQPPDIQIVEAAVMQSGAARSVASPRDEGRRPIPPHG